MNGRMLAKKILRIGYYWNTMEANNMDYVKSFHDCQTHTNLNHVPLSDLYSMTFCMAILSFRYRCDQKDSS